MAIKELNARLPQKHDYEANWIKAINFVPMKGEIIVYDPEIDARGNVAILPEGRTSPYDYARFKCGDGETKVNDLPFMFAYLEDKIDDLAEEVNTLGQVLNEKVSVEINGSQLVFTK